MIKSWRSSAPSNIALIKYMGKQNRGEGNLPTNTSLSFTLNHLQTHVFISPKESGNDAWEPLSEQGLSPIDLSLKSQGRFLDFFADLKKQWKIPGSYLIQSANNFPSDCGLASSASSFAALTLATHELAKEFGVDCTLADLSALSRRGSGSSCRSFFAPFAKWDGETAQSVDLGIEDLLHQVVVVGAEKKQVSSSEAHLRVLTSSLFKGRVERAQLRYDQLVSALKTGDWGQAFQIAWAEFWDMHALFETSAPPFGYMNSGSLIVLKAVRDHWNSQGDGPIVTMDAGANVHLLYREDQIEVAGQLVRDSFSVFDVIQSPKLDGKP